MAKHTDNLTEPQDARSCLVMAALRIFAEKGFAAATTRNICQLAGANISAIRYYFGDKAGLYRAAFIEPMGDAPCHLALAACADLPLPQALALFFREFLAPLKQGETSRLAMKLRFREMVEPTGVWQEEIDAEIKPLHDVLLALLQRHFALAEPDDDLQRLAFAVIGMAVHFYVGQDVVACLAPQLLATPADIEILAERLASYAVAIIEGEVQRRL
ncbi:CerR family C-terminal domain-containing protein [Methylovulum psychrotolerans]|uniref:CerR family C-terminal domain-containing protein n=1 Tax=Methylovulum psychrotolerans TaxID=1704499 RepID=UPI001BFF81A6|nr:CerR family C-terminal domain-containing protein [Methylovulum psychrotolerans]MBT9098225.1 CerR family C-terminal domain-containing protein [Methylovulum psychrotolerans]